MQHLVSSVAEACSVSALRISQEDKKRQSNAPYSKINLPKRNNEETKEFRSFSSKERTRNEKNGTK